MLLPLLWYWNGMEGPSFTDKWYPSLQPLMQFSVRDFSFPAFYMQMLPRHPCAAEGSCPWLTVRKMRSRRNVSDLVTAWVKGMLRATSLKRSSAWVNLHPACPCLERRGNICFAFALTDTAVLPNLGVLLAGLCCDGCRPGKESVWLLWHCVLVGKLSCWWHLLLGS